MISFKDLLKSKTAELLDKWITDAISYKIHDMDSFVKGLKSEIDAERNAIIYSFRMIIFKKIVIFDSDFYSRISRVIYKFRKKIVLLRNYGYTVTLE